MINQDQLDEVIKMMLSIFKIGVHFTAKYNVNVQRLMMLNK